MRWLAIISILSMTASAEAAPGFGFDDPMTAKRCLIEAAEKLPRLPELAITEARLSMEPEDIALVADQVALFMAAAPENANILATEYRLIGETPTPVPTLSDTKQIWAQVTAYRAHVAQVLTLAPEMARVATIAFKAGPINGTYRAVCLRSATRPMVFWLGLAD